MIKIYLFMIFLLIPKVLIASTCGGGTFLHYSINEYMPIISFKVLAESEITITRQFHGVPIKDDELIQADDFWGPAIPSPSKDNEWIAVLDPIFLSKDLNDRIYELQACNKLLRIENNTIELDFYNKIGIAALDDLEKPATLTVSGFELILKAYFQGLKSADDVCKYNGSYCNKVMPRYNRQTKELRIPALYYFNDNKSYFIDTTLQRSGGNPNIIFTVKDLKIESEY